MRNLLLSITAAFLIASCVESAPARLPEPIAEIKDPVQWQEFCQREGQNDPACKKD